MNNYEKTFLNFLYETGFDLLKNEDGTYHLKDLYGANLGDIEDDTFETAEQMIERMDAYVDDYIFDDLDNLFGEFVEEQGGWSAFGIEGEEATAWLEFKSQLDGVDKSLSSEFELASSDFDFLDLIVSHIGDVNLDEVFKLKTIIRMRSLIDRISSENRNDEDIAELKQLVEILLK